MNGPMNQGVTDEVQALSDDELVHDLALSLINVQDRIISSLSIPRNNSDAEISAGDAEPAVIERIRFNVSLINSIRFRNCRMLIAAGLPSYATQEFTSLTSLTFDELDSFYRDLSASIGARNCHEWYSGSSGLISNLLVNYDEDTLTGNFNLLSATCIECALVDNDYELAEIIADSSDQKPPYKQRALEWLCIAYWLAPNRGEDAIKWAEIAIMHRCISQVPFIIKCRISLQMGEFEKALSCLDEAERFFF